MKIVIIVDIPSIADPDSAEADFAIDEILESGLLPEPPYQPGVKPDPQRTQWWIEEVYGPDEAVPQPPA